MTTIPLGISVDNSIGSDSSYHSPILWITRYVDVAKPGKKLSQYWPNGGGCRYHNAGAFRKVDLIARVVLSAPLSARSPTSSVSSRIPHKTLRLASSLVRQIVRSANSSVLQIGPFPKNSVTCSFRKSSVSSRNPRETAPPGVVARSAGSSIPWIC